MRSPEQSHQFFSPAPPSGPNPVYLYAVPDAVDVAVLLSQDAILPSYQTPGAAGLDLCCSEEFELLPMERKMIGTGVRIAVPPGYEAQVRPRSGLAWKFGISMVNSPGTIDSDYRGELKIILINFGSEGVRFDKGERIGQLVLCPVVRANLQVVDELDQTKRGEGGFGSTGR